MDMTHWVRALFWAVPFVVTVVLSVFLLYSSRKDRESARGSEPKIRVDRDKILRVFTNLIKNAFDAMRDGGSLTIRSEKIENDACISFIDTGPGINEENLQKLWTPLFTTKTKGMGFGLSICKRFVEARGGRILVESQTGKGTTFIVAIPIEAQEQNKDFIVSLPKTEVHVKVGEVSI